MATGYGMGAAYGQGITRVRDVHWLAELGIAQAIWVLEVDRIGPFLVEGDAGGRSLFALANREIDARIAEVYQGLPKLALSRFGRGHAAYGRPGLIGILGLAGIAVASVAISYLSVTS